MTTTPTPSQAPLSAGAVPELPYSDDALEALWEKARNIGIGKMATRHQARNFATLIHAPAQAIIHAQAAEIERLKRERDEALQKVALAKTVCDEYMKRHDELAVRFDDLDAELEALKAKQVAEADEVMRLADKYAEQYAAQFATHYPVGTDHRAAREALRAALTKDRT